MSRGIDGTDGFFSRIRRDSPRLTAIDRPWARWESRTGDISAMNDMNAHEWHELGKAGRRTRVDGLVADLPLGSLG